MNATFTENLDTIKALNAKGVTLFGRPAFARLIFTVAGSRVDITPQDGAGHKVLTWAEAGNLLNSLVPVSPADAAYAKYQASADKEATLTGSELMRQTRISDGLFEHYLQLRDSE